MSPLLFVLLMEYLSTLYGYTGKHEGFKFHPHCKEIKLTHLIFVDDLIVFSAADGKTLSYLKEAINKFSSSIGLMANKAKSQIVMGGCNDQQREQILQLIGYQEGKLPFKYLGVPVPASRLSAMDCSLLVDKITKKIAIWATKTKSYAGRVALINGLLMGIYSFWATIFILPKKVIKEVNDKFRNFL